MFCNQKDNVYYGYKSRQFFDSEKIEEKKGQKTAKVIKKIIDQVTMKEELNLLAKLIHHNFGPNSINNLMSSMSFIPVNWHGDPAIYCEEEVPDPTGSSSSLEPLDKHDQKSKVIGQKDKDDDHPEAEGSNENIILSKKYVFNVPYIFSKVELKRHH